MIVLASSKSCVYCLFTYMIMMTNVLSGGIEEKSRQSEGNVDDVESLHCPKLNALEKHSQSQKFMAPALENFAVSKSRFFGEVTPSV